MTIKIWKNRPAYFVLLEILKKKEAITSEELFMELNEEFTDFSHKEFYELLMQLEVHGKIRTTSMARGKRRIELVS